MAKKSNKTEQVLKLITKDDEKLEDINDSEESPEVDIKVLEQEKQEHKIEAKLKIEITPEIEVIQTPDDRTAHSTLINLTERLVRENCREVMERLNVCSCETCTQDVLALVLNSLKQKYVTTDAGKQRVLLDIYKKQYETDIIAALTRACVRVKAAPKHEK